MGNSFKLKRNKFYLYKKSHCVYTDAILTLSIMWGEMGWGGKGYSFYMGVGWG